MTEFNFDTVFDETMQTHNQWPAHSSSELSTSVTPHPNDAGLLSLCPPLTVFEIPSN